MSPELHTTLAMNRHAHYYSIMRTTIFTLAALAIGIEVAPDGYSAALTMAVIGAVAYGVLAGNSAMDDLKNLIDDVDEEIAKTNYGAGLAQKPMGMFKMASTSLLILLGLAELLAIFT